MNIHDSTHERCIILAFGEKLARNISASALPSQIEEGLPANALRTLKRLYGLDNRGLGCLLGIDERTVERRIKGSRLPLVESDRAWRLFRLWAEAEFVLEAEEPIIREWFTSPSARLGGRTPLELAHTEEGARWVSDDLTRMEYGIPV